MKPAAVVADAYASAERIFTKQLEDEVSKLTAPDGLSNERSNQWFTRERALIGWMIADAMKSYAENMLDHHKDQLKQHGVLARADKIDEGSEGAIYEGALANLVCKVGAPSVSVDKEAIVRRLSTIHDFTDEDVRNFMTAVTKTSAPRKTFRIVPRVGV